MAATCSGSGLHVLPLPRRSPTMMASTTRLPAKVVFLSAAAVSQRCFHSSTHFQPIQHLDLAARRNHLRVGKRHIHYSKPRTNTVAAPGSLPVVAASQAVPEIEGIMAKRAPLSMLPLSMILRSLVTLTVSSSSTLLPPSLRAMSLLAHSSNPVLNPDKNPLLGFLIRNSLYAQFCAGANNGEVRQTIGKLKGMGFSGVILCYAKEVVLSESQIRSMAAGGNAGAESREAIENEILPWAQGTLETVKMTDPGDFVALKFTGAGSVALHLLSKRLPASPFLAKCIDNICRTAHERGVRLMFDAEQDALQNGIDDWTLEYARKYNTSPEKATVYGTYQAYKKVAPAILSNHLAIAQRDGFTLGVKLVRGAYLGSDPRECFHDTKEETDLCYNSMASSVITRQWGPTVTGEGEFPASHINLATHNAESVRRARAICDAGEAKCSVDFAQLQGMADDISCELVDAGQRNPKTADGQSSLPVYKYLVWGTTGECMKYLLRRAYENKDAVQRTRSARDAMGVELLRRLRMVVGLA